MELAKIAVALSGLPALIMFALSNPHHMGFVLSEIKGLSWMNFTPDSFVEVFIGNLAVAIIVEFVENVLELLGSQI
jgi:hypothetical protein